MAKLTPEEYTELKDFFRFFTERFFKMDGIGPELRPLAVLEATEKGAPGRAAQGLRMAVNDCTEMSSHWTADQVRVLDSELGSLGLLTLSQVRRRYARTYASIVKRGRIRNEVDYYLIQATLSDQTLALTNAECQNLETMVLSYEQKAF